MLATDSFRLSPSADHAVVAYEVCKLEQPTEQDGWQGIVVPFIGVHCQLWVLIRSAV